MKFFVFLLGLLWVESVIAVEKGENKWLSDESILIAIDVNKHRNITRHVVEASPNLLRICF